MKKSSVMVCDPQFLTREGLKSIINRNPFYEVLGEAAHPDALEQMIKVKAFEIVTIDYAHEGSFDVDCISMVQELAPETQIIVISNERNKRHIFDVLGRGINHYITKNCREDEIYKALDACRNDEKFYCGRILDIIINRTFRGEEKLSPLLTAREKEIVTLIAQGKVAKEIAAMLNISVHTMYTHRKNIMKKLEISSPVELITYAINNNLVEL